MPQKRKPTNKISPGRKPKPAANNIRNMNKDVTTNYDNKQLKKIEQRQQKAVTKARAIKPVGANAQNAVYSRSGMMGGGTRKTGVSGVAYALAKPVVDKAATHLGKKLGKALRPAGRAIDKALGIKSKPTGSKKRQKK